MTDYYRKFEGQVYAMAVGYILGLLTALMIVICTSRLIGPSSE